MSYMDILKGMALAGNGGGAGGLNYSTEEQDTGLKHCYDMDGYFGDAIYQRTITDFTIWFRSDNNIVEELDEPVMIISSELTMNGDAGIGTMPHICAVSVVAVEEKYSLTLTDADGGTDFDPLALTIWYLKPAANQRGKNMKFTETRKN